MTTRLMTFLRRFKRDESGQMLLEFAVGVPLVFTIFMTSVEMGIYSMRQMWLDRGLDIAVRDIRLRTGDKKITHSYVKNRICETAGFLPDCTEVLRLEMRSTTMRAFNGLGTGADCVDVSKPINDPRQFDLGVEHELMVLRACYMFEPVFPTTGLGKEFDKQGGRVMMTSYSAFVQEPQ